MSILSDSYIQKLIEEGQIVIKPLTEDDIQPASVEVHIDGWGSVFDGKRTIDPKNPPTPEEYSKIEFPTILSPGRMLIVSTIEWVEIPNFLVAEVWGKSSLARLGLQVHCTAGYIDPGFKGNITLELTVHNSVGILISPGMKIGQLNFSDVKGHVKRPYGTKGLGSRYLGQSGPTTSRGIDSIREG